MSYFDISKSMSLSNEFSGDVTIGFIAVTVDIVAADSSKMKDAAFEYLAPISWLKSFQIQVVYDLKRRSWPRCRHIGLRGV